jgi:hypothetical protein
MPSNPDDNKAEIINVDEEEPDTLWGQILYPWKIFGRQRIVIATVGKCEIGFVCLFVLFCFCCCWIDLVWFVGRWLFYSRFLFIFCALSFFSL